jgi:hypothetical protein
MTGEYCEVHGRDISSDFGLLTANVKTEPNGPAS